MRLLTISSSIFEPTIPPIEVNAIDAEVLFISTTTFSPMIGTISSIVIPTVAVENVTMDSLPVNDFPTCKEYPGCSDMVAKLALNAPSDSELAIRQATARLQGLIN